MRAWQRPGHHPARPAVNMMQVEDVHLAGQGMLPALDLGGHLVRLERRVSERLAEAGDFIRHIPRTISSDEAAFSETNEDRLRLQERLLDNGLCERTVEGDGNCQVHTCPETVCSSACARTRLRFRPGIDVGWSTAPSKHSVAAFWCLLAGYSQPN